MRVLARKGLARPGCGWNTGTVYTGPALCGKTAKYRTDNPSTNNRLVCGIHARRAVRRHDENGDFYTVTPLTESTPEPAKGGTR